MIKSSAFPIMFGNTSAKIISDREATKSNLRLLLLSEKNSLLGDPYYGTNIRKMFYEQNNQVLKDIVIDDIYLAILTFMPQITIQRKDINVTNDRYSIYVEITCLNNLDYNMENYVLKLLDIEDLY